MDSFESVVASILQRQGFWTMTSLKVELTKGEKRAIGRHSSPRWEIDVVAYRGADNQLWVVECKSFLDSSGVDHRDLDGGREIHEGRYKLFHDSTLRKVVLGRLKRQLAESGHCPKSTKVKLCLAAGKVHGSEDRLSEHFKRKGWLFLGPTYIREELVKLSETGYENSVEAVVSKVLMRGKS